MHGNLRASLEHVFAHESNRSCKLKQIQFAQKARIQQVLAYLSAVVHLVGELFPREHVSLPWLTAVSLFAVALATPSTAHTTLVLFLAAFEELFDKLLEHPLVHRLGDLCLLLLLFAPILRLRV